MKKFKVGVFIGGKTSEKEVSFNSGRTVCDHLDTSKYDIIPIFQNSLGNLYILPWKFLHRGKINDFEHRLEKESKKILWDDLKSIVDFIYIASHGHYVEDGTLQGMLEVLQIPYLGSKVLSSAISMDKFIQKKILKANNIRVPNFISVTPQDLEFFKKNKNIDNLLKLIKNKNIDFPCIVKPYKEGSSLGISVVKSKENLLNALVNASKTNFHTTQSVIIEEFIEGMEFSCILITDYKTGNIIALPPTEIVIEPDTLFFDYEQKYMPGRAIKFTPARRDKEIIKKIQDTCAKVMKILEIENLARIDGFVDKNGKIIIIDPNTLAGMSPSTFIFRQAAEHNMSHTNLINHLIETELKRYNLLENIVKKEAENSITNQNKRIRVAVLFGGKSNEREISLESGRNILYKLSPQKYEAIPIFVSQDLKLYKVNQSLLVRNSTKEIALAITEAMNIKWANLNNISDFVFIGLHGGEGENGCVQGTLETLNIPYNGSSVLTSALCMNKFKTNEFLKIQNIDVPKNILVCKKSYQKNKQDIIFEIEKSISYPIIVKPHDDGCSVLVKKAKNRKELEESVQEVFNNNKNFVFLEEYIDGMELTVGVIGNNKVKALPPSQTVTATDILSIEEKFLPGQGENQTPAPLSKVSLELVENTVENVYKTLNCKGYARIDCFYQTAEQSPTKKERVVIIEVNTLPGMTPATCIFHQASEVGIKPMDFIDLIIQLGFEEHQKQSNFSKITTNINELVG